MKVRSSISCNNTSKSCQTSLPMGISVSAYIALCAVVYTMRLISVSAHSTLWTSHYETYISIKPYHTNMYSGFHYETYIAINPYRSILVIYDCYVMSDRIEWECMTVMSCLIGSSENNTNVVHFSCEMEKYSPRLMNIERVLYLSISY